jgi:cytidylate kinase
MDHTRQAMSPIVIVTGAPGTGKTTLAAHLAKASPRGLHLPADLFFTFPAHPISPYRPASQEQNTTVMIALARTAATFTARGYDVFLEGIVGPWFLPPIAAELAPIGIPVEYVVLRAPLEVALKRVRGRGDIDRDHIVQQMHGAFEAIGSFSTHTLDASNRSTAEVAAEFASRQAAGAFALDLTAVAASGTN